jgi:hypothetical protein
MNLQQQIEKTIQAYEEACKKENLNFDYCYNNMLEAGICLLCLHNGYGELHRLISTKVNKYLTLTPEDIENNIFKNANILIKNPTILKCHKARIKFLKQLLKNEHNKKILS